MKITTISIFMSDLALAWDDQTSGVIDLKKQESSVRVLFVLVKKMFLEMFIKVSAFYPKIPTVYFDLKKLVFMEFVFFGQMVTMMVFILTKC